MYSGFLNVLKPPGMSSHDVVGSLRRIYGQKKIGHAGTLDPAAAGVLPVAFGHATRLLEYIVDTKKSYRVELTLGYETDSGDDTGQVTRTASFAMPAPAVVDAVLQTFCGETIQTPPMHSAIKVHGQKLYELARQGISIEIPTRTIFIDGISLLAIQSPRFLFDVQCSKGTYIRALCMDIGKKLDIPAVMSFLIRTNVGSFSLNSAYALEEIQAQPLPILQPMDSVLQHLPAVAFNATQALFFRQGQKIYGQRSLKDVGFIRAYDETHTFVGIGKYIQSFECIIPVKVISR